jgi:CBS domain-containing protein
MATTIREVMAPDPVCLPATATAAAAAGAMRDADIGNVIVQEDGRLAGIVTDRDIAVRVVAEGRDPNGVTLKQICSGNVVSLSPEDSVEDAVRLMRERALRRLPVIDRGHPIGIVSLGDLAIERDPQSALASISGASPNK